MSGEKVLRQAVEDHRRELSAFQMRYGQLAAEYANANARWEALRKALRKAHSALEWAAHHELDPIPSFVHQALNESEAALAALEEPAPAMEDAGDVACYHHGMGQLSGLTTAAEMADKWAAQYPTDVFLPDGTSIEARAAHHARRVAGFIAKDIRDLIAECSEPAPSEAPDREALVAEVAALRAEVERLSKWNDVINRLNERVKAAEAALATERARAPEAGGFEGHPPGVCLEHSRFRLEGAGLIDTEGPLSLCTGCGKLPPHAGCQAICAACATPTGACYCAGCQVAGKASPPPAPAAPSEELEDPGYPSWRRGL